MAKEHPKQVVIIKDIKSNFIEEAIFVLKNNNDYTDKITNAISLQGNKYNSDALIYEAQNIIDNYIKKHSGAYGYIKSIKHSNKDYKKSKKFNLHMAMLLNIALILSAVTLFILLFKFI